MSSSALATLDADGPVIATPDGPRLLGGRCLECGAVLFPWRDHCPPCGADGVVREALPAEGTLWTWTIQGFPPKPPYRPREPDGAFVPFGVGYVELAGALRIEAPLTLNDPDRLRIGQRMRLIELEGPDGAAHFAFSEVDGEGAEGTPQ